MSGLPGLAAFEKKHRDDPFTLVGIAGPDDPEDVVAGLCKASGVAFAVTAGGYYPDRTGEIPFAVVWDPAGREVYRGSPGGAESAVEKLLPSVPALYLGDRVYDRLKPLSAQIERKSALGQAAQTLRQKLDSEDVVERDEARSLLGFLEGYARGRSDSAEAFLATDPEKALEILRTLSKEFAGDPVGTRASDRAGTLAGDPAFKRLVEGFRQLRPLDRKLASLSVCKRCKSRAQREGSLSCAECRKANEALLGQLRRDLGSLIEDHAGTAVSDRARDLLMTIP